MIPLSPRQSRGKIAAAAAGLGARWQAHAAAAGAPAQRQTRIAFGSNALGR
jgi:hypothetical protein